LIGEVLDADLYTPAFLLGLVPLPKVFYYSAFCVFGYENWRLAKKLTGESTLEYEI